MHVGGEGGVKVRASRRHPPGVRLGMEPGALCYNALAGTFE